MHLVDQILLGSAITDSDLPPTPLFYIFPLTDKKKKGERKENNNDFKWLKGQSSKKEMRKNKVLTLMRFKWKVTSCDESVYQSRFSTAKATQNPLCEAERIIF